MGTKVITEVGMGRHMSVFSRLLCLYHTKRVVSRSGYSLGEQSANNLVELALVSLLTDSCCLAVVPSLLLRIAPRLELWCSIKSTAHSYLALTPPFASVCSWRVLTNATQYDSLKSSLEPKGLREGQLCSAMVRHSDVIKRGMPSQPVAAPIPIEEQPQETQGAASAACSWRLGAIRPQAQMLVAEEDDYVADMELLPSDGPRVRKLKQDMLRVEAGLPPDAIVEEGGFRRWVGLAGSA